MAKYKPFVIPFVIALFVLGGIAWGIGWLAHAAVDRAAAPPAPLPPMTATVIVVSPATPATLAQPQVNPPATPTAAATSTTETPVNLNPTSTLQPTSVPIPELPTPYVVIVPQGWGVLAICREHCPNLSHSDQDLQKCVRRVGQINRLKGSRDNPQVYVGQHLEMPPECFSP